MQRRSLLKLAGAPWAAAVTGAVWAQSPRQLRIIVPLPAGSSIDFITRTVVPSISATLGQPVVVENKAGANGILGMQDLMRSPPDGNTLLFGSLSPLSVNVALVKNLPYDPRRDITPIAGLGLTNHVLIVKSGFPARTVPEFIAHAKQHPGKVSVGHSTTLVQAQIAMMNRMAGIELQPIPYKGIPATITDLLGGVLDATLVDPGNALAQIKGGHVRALGVSSLKRNPLTPDWPAISETLPGFDFSSWTAVVGPPGMPREAVNRTHAAVSTAIRQKDVIDKYAQSATVPLPLTPEELKALIETDTAKWVRVAREANLQAE